MIIMQNVSIVECLNYNQENLFSSIQKSLDKIGGLPSFVKPNQKVLLKVNMLAAHHPDKAVTTHPEFVRAVIKLVKEAGGIPSVGDSPGFDNPKKAAKACGYLKICEEEGVPFVYFKESVEVKNPNGRRFKSFQIAKPIADADVIINLPKLKTHGLTGITCAVKNLFGCIPGLLKAEYHVKVPTKNDFNQMLLDLLEVVKPALSIVDAVVAMEGGGGPAAGVPKQIGLIAASADAIELDKALIEELKKTDFKFIISTPNDFSMAPSFIGNFARSVLAEKPVVDKKKCTGCKICGKVCMSKAISYSEAGKPETKRLGFPVFDYNKCIRCFCCAEMCPEHAVDVKRNWMAKILFFAFSKIGV